jgi:hypothetical protein
VRATVTLEQLLEQSDQDLEQDIQNDGGPETYYKYEIENHADLSLDEIMKMGREVDRFYMASETIGDRGCSFAVNCDLRTGRIYDICWDDRDFGAVNFFKQYVENHLQN